MKTSVEPLEGNKVKVSVEVDETEFEREVDAAFRRIAREVRIPGFRPGKAPRRVLEARVGSDAGREEAIRHAVPEYYAQAVRDNDVDVIAQPEIDVTGGEDTGPVVFDAVVEVRPVITVGGYENLRVTVPRPEVSDEDVDAQVDRLREGGAELSPVERPAVDGDNVRIDIVGNQDGEPVAGLTADDYLYEVGTGAVVPELDDQLRGSKAGDILQFTAAHPDPEQSEVSFRILVKEVNAKVLPEADDEWAAETSEFSTVAELRADLRQRAETVRRAQTQMALQARTSEALAELVTEDVPEAMVDGEVQSRLQDLAMRLQAQGLDLEQYLEMSGRDTEDLLRELRTEGEQGVRVDLALRALVDAESITVDDEEMDAEIERFAEQAGQKPARARRQLEREGQLSLVRSGVARRKALDWLVDHVEVVDPDGEAIDRGLLEPPDEAEAPTLVEAAGEAPEDRSAAETAQRPEAAGGDATADDAGGDATADDDEPSTDDAGAPLASDAGAPDKEEHP